MKGRELEEKAGDSLENESAPDPAFNDSLLPKASDPCAFW
jgi:hypothetical protein